MPTHNNPLLRGARGVLECINWMCLTHPLPPLKRGIHLIQNWIFYSITLYVSK